MKYHGFDNRRYVFSAMVIVVVLTYIIRLFYLQVLSTEYRDSAKSNAFLKRTLLPERGAIYDRQGRMLVGNQSSFDVMVVMRNVRNLDTLRFCNTLDITVDEFRNRMADIRNTRKNPGYSSYVGQVFMNQLTLEEISRLRESLYLFPGFSIQSNSFRQYRYSAAAHLLGDMGEVSKSEMESDPYYSRGDFIGKQGVEKQYETYLRGVKGTEILLRDAVGRIQGHYLDGALDRPSVPGSSITLSIDIELQMLGERLMKNKIGSIVAIEPSTGEVLCMVSSPTYDPSDLVGRHRSANYGQLSSTWSKPLLNRTIMGTYPPGSTFKTAQALTMLQEGIITTETLFPCSRGFVFRNLRVGCHSHPSPLRLREAIATSCNGYFCWGYYRFIGSDKYKSPQEALTVWKDYMVAMGFGYTLGIDLPGEKRGMIPNAQYYDKAYGRHWNGLTIISNSIGQGEITLTPLQIANLGATIANRGWFYTPHVVKAIEDNEIDSTYKVRHSTGIDRQNYEYVVEGMRQSVISGTCVSAASGDYIVCGKTGTAENRGHDHSVFMGFAPMENPRIAIAVYVENGGFGAVYGVPIGALMMEQFINGYLSEASLAKAEQMENRIVTYDEQER